MPRGNPHVWKGPAPYGASYSDLAGTTTTVESIRELAPRRLPPFAPAAAAEAQTTRGAGMKSGTLPRGVGTFLLESRWSFGSQAAPPAGGGASLPVPSSISAPPSRSYATEVGTSYLPPPAGRSRTDGAGPRASSLPKPSYPNDWTTTKQAEYRSDGLQNLDPARSMKSRDAGRLLPQDVPPGSQFTTQQRSQFVGHTSREAAAITPSGGKATHLAGYNIVTGAVPYGNHGFEHWDGRDYRRHR